MHETIHFNTHLLHSFNLTWLTTAPTPRPDHILDLDLSFGISICNLDITDAFSLEFYIILFDMLLLLPPATQHLPFHQSHYINSSTANYFVESFKAATDAWSIAASLLYLSHEDFTNLFKSTCSSIMDTAALYKLRKSGLKQLSWLND